MLSDRERAQANNLRADAWRAVKVCIALKYRTEAKVLQSFEIIEKNINKAS